jgi:class 3 adenylate cyclase
MPGARSAVPSAAITVLFADISGSALLCATRGDETAYELISTCLTLLEEQVQRVGGRVIKRVGDAILAVFDGAEPAVHAAAGMQFALEAPGCELRAEGVRVRVGIATGTAVLDAGDVYGDVVNVAARLISLAGADEVFLAGETYDVLPAPMRGAIRVIDQLALRGRPGWVVVYQYLWKKGATISTVVRPRDVTAALEITYNGETYGLGPERPKLTIGRDPDNDVVIPEAVVSSHHAEVVLRGDKFLLVDRSTNGTWVLTDGGDTFRVTREELTLTGSGRILPGRQTLQPLRYRVGPRGAEPPSRETTS